MTMQRVKDLVITEGTFELSTVTYTTGASDPSMGQPLTVRLVQLNDGPGNEADFDDVRLTAVPACIGDTDASGTVDVTDMIAVIVAWGTADPAADVNGDGTVDVTDLVTVILAWGECG